MSKNQLSESEALDEKIKRIRKKNEEIEKRRLEVEADKQSAAKLNALVQLSAPKEDWPPPRSYISDEDAGRPSVNTQEKSRERNRGTITFDNSLYEGKRPPPDPAYKFLADAERDPVPSKSSSKYQQITQGRGRAAPRSRGRGNKINTRDNQPFSEKGTPGYEAWRAERNRIDEERIRRQRTAQGQWRREWDNQKSEDDWQAPNNDARREQNPAQNNRIASIDSPSEFSQRRFMSRNQVSEEEFKRDTGNMKVGRNATDLSPDLQLDTLSSNANKPMRPAISLNASQNSGNSLHVSFVNDACTQKAPSRRLVAGSGRLGPPLPAGPRRSVAECGEGSSGAGPQPQRRIREARRRRRATATAGPQRKISAGDDSWEDADEPSEGEAEAAATPSEGRTDGLEKRGDEEHQPSQGSYTLLTDVSSSLKADGSSYLLPHNSNDVTHSQNRDPSVVSANDDCAAIPLIKNPLSENSMCVVGKANNGNGDHVEETTTCDVGSITSVMEYNKEKRDNEFSIKVLEHLDEPAQNELSTKEENLESTESAALENDCTNLNNGISIVDCSSTTTTTTVSESGCIELEKDEILDAHLISSMIPEDKNLSAQIQEEVTTSVICGENSEKENPSNDYKPCEPNCEEPCSFESNINILQSNNTDCRLTNDRSEEQITPIVEKKETICDSTECINISDNKDILAIDKNFHGVESAENNDASTNIIEDMSRDLVKISEAKESSLISDEQIPQPDCPTSDILGDISQITETKSDLNQNSSQDYSEKTDIKLSNSDKAEISRNMEKLSISSSKENVSSNS